MVTSIGLSLATSSTACSPANLDWAYVLAGLHGDSSVMARSRPGDSPWTPIVLTRTKRRAPAATPNRQRPAARSRFARKYSCSESLPRSLRMCARPAKWMMVSIRPGHAPISVSNCGGTESRPAESANCDSRWREIVQTAQVPWADSCFVSLLPMKPFAPETRIRWFTTLLDTA